MKSVGCCLVVAASMLAVDGTAAGARATEDGVAPGPSGLARNAAQAVLKGLGAPDLDTAVRQADRAVAERAARTPQAVTSASVVPVDGLAAAEAAAFVTRYGLDLISAEAKAQLPGSDEVQTMWFNDLELIQGSLSQKLERAVGKVRLRKLNQAQAAAPADQAKLRALATGDIRFYRLEVAGSYRTLARLTGDPSVAVVVPAQDDRKVAALRDLRAKLKTDRVPGPAAPPLRLVSGDPTRQTAGTPVLTNSGQQCAWQQSEGLLACQPAPRPSISGQAIVDSALPQRKGALLAGTSAPAAESADEPIRTLANAFTDCRVSSTPEGCPNDFTYSPRPQTSGGQGFSALVDAYPAGSVVFYDCYIVWVPGNGGSENDGGYWQTICYPSVITTRAFTYGAAAWLSRWGAQTTNINNANRIVSTLAFKGSDLTACDVDQFGGSAECDPSVPNSIYVPSPGLEDELLIDNPACTGGSRDGTTSDWERGCFYPTYAETSLPAPFLDTTFGDPATAPYDLAIGSSDAAQIVENRQYLSYAEFFSWGFNDMFGRRAVHRVSVDAEVLASAACAFGLVRGELDAFCHFPVDSVDVSAPAFFS